MQFKRHLFVLEALEPVSHGDTLTGTDSNVNLRLFMRSGLVVDGVPSRVPDISENALRSVMFRIPLHDHLLSTLGVKPGDLPQAVVNLLFAGGNLAAGSNTWDANYLGHQVTELYPSLSLLGGATDHFVLPRSKLRLASWPLAREFVPYLSGIATNKQIEEAEEISVFDMLFEETRTRGTSDRTSGNQMLYSYETLAAGAKFLLEATLPAHTPVRDEAALGAALSWWDGYFGGQGRQGRGRMTLSGERPDTGPYKAHLEEHKDKMLEGLTSGHLGTDKPLAVL